MKSAAGFALSFAACLCLASSALGQEAVRVSFAQVLAQARQASPVLAAVRSREAVAAADVGVAGIYPNPIVSAATSSQLAKLSLTGSFPLVILGQRAAAVRASRADLAAVRIDTQVAQADIRSGAAHAYVNLWQAERVAQARGAARDLGRVVQTAVATRVDLGSAPELDGLRAQAEFLGLSASAEEARRLVGAAAGDLGRYLGVPDATNLRTAGAPVIPERLQPLGELLRAIGASPTVRRQEAGARAADLHAAAERALVRPAMTLDLGVDLWDPTIPATNYRVALGVEVPLFNQRGPFIEREERNAKMARLQAGAERVNRSADLVAAYRNWEGATARRQALQAGALTSAAAAAKAARESYELGRAPLEAVLDAARVLVDTELALHEADAARAHSYIDVEHALGQL